MGNGKGRHYNGASLLNNGEDAGSAIEEAIIMVEDNPKSISKVFTLCLDLKKGCKFILHYYWRDMYGIL